MLKPVPVRTCQSTSAQNAQVKKAASPPGRTHTSSRRAAGSFWAWPAPAPPPSLQAGRLLLELLSLLAPPPAPSCCWGPPPYLARLLLQPAALRPHWPGTACSRWLAHLRGRQLLQAGGLQNWAAAAAQVAPTPIQRELAAVGPGGRHWLHRVAVCMFPWLQTGAASATSAAGLQRVPAAEGA